MRICFSSFLAIAAFSFSLAVRGQQTAPAQPKFDNVQVEGIKWTTFHDPKENAFSLDVPEGWKVDGGLVRRSNIDTSTFLRVLSPDGAVMLLMGDPGPAVFHLPAFGAPRGSQPYRPGNDFARSYGESALPALCSGVTIESAAERSDIASGPFAKAVPGSHYDAGEAFFSCMHNSKPTRAYVVAGTYLYTSLAFWGVNLLDGCIAPADRIDKSRKMLLHMLLSSRNDPQWVRDQQARVDQATRNILIVTEGQKAAFASNLANAQAQQRAMTQQYNAFNEVQTQTGTFVDTSGHRYTLSNTQPYHWIGPGGKTLETASPNPPGAGWTQLQQVPPK